MDDPEGECGVFGIFGHPEAAWLTYLGLHALQHRGQEGAGICTAHDGRLHVHRGRGLIAEVFPRDIVASLPGTGAIGHNRYSTTGSDHAANLQPLIASYRDGTIAIAHNGNLVNAKELREECEHLGSIFQTTVDSEVIVHLLARARPEDLVGRLRQALSRVRGAYSLVGLTPDALIGIRDPHGFRPLCLGQLEGAWILASESCALDILGAEYVREIEPGEMVVIDKDGLATHRFGVDVPRAECVFEHVYFARPDSRTFGRGVSEIRVRLGRALAREHPAQADLVISVPDSSNAAALGYSRESGIPLDHGLIRNHYVGRTSHQPATVAAQPRRASGTTSCARRWPGSASSSSTTRSCAARRAAASCAWSGGEAAREIHFRVSSPPVVHPVTTASTCPRMRSWSRTDAPWSRSASSSAWTRWGISRRKRCSGGARRRRCGACSVLHGAVSGEMAADPLEGRSRGEAELTVMGRRRPPPPGLRSPPRPSSFLWNVCR